MFKYLKLKFKYISKKNYIAFFIITSLFLSNGTLTNNTVLILLFAISDFDYIGFLRSKKLVKRHIFQKIEHVKMFGANCIYYFVPLIPGLLFLNQSVSYAVVGTIVAALICQGLLYLNQNNYIYLLIFGLVEFTIFKILT